MALAVGDVRVIYTHDHDSGMAEDRVDNVFHFTHVGLGPPDYDAAAQLCFDFFNDAHAPAPSIRAQLGSTLSGGWTARVYDLVDPIPRVPKVILTGVYSVGASCLPEEVCLCLSFQGDPISGELQRRKRGRVYIGPLVDGIRIDSATPRPNDTFINGIRAAAVQLRDDSATNEMLWSVYSRADNKMVVVTNGWVDNSFDTQRRRGPDSTARHTWN